MTLDAAFVARTVRTDPVCQHRAETGRYCRGLSVSAALVAGGDPTRPDDYRSRCGIHAELDAPRFERGGWPTHPEGGDPA